MSGGRAAKRKGAAFERQIAKVFQERLGDAYQIERGLGQARSGSEVPDVNGVPNLWIECKNQQKVNIKAALKQAEDAIAAAESKKKPIAVCKESRSKVIVSLYLEDFLDLTFPQK